MSLVWWVTVVLTRVVNALVKAVDSFNKARKAP